MVVIVIVRYVVILFVAVGTTVPFTDRTHLIVVVAVAGVVTIILVPVLLIKQYCCSSTTTDSKFPGRYYRAFLIVLGLCWL